MRGVSSGTDDEAAARMGTAWRHIFECMPETAEADDCSATTEVCSACDHAGALFGTYARTDAKVDNRC